MCAGYTMRPHHQAVYCVFSALLLHFGKHSLRGLGEIAFYDDQVPTGGIVRERVGSHEHDPVRFRNRR